MISPVVLWKSLNRFIFLIAVETHGKHVSAIFHCKNQTKTWKISSSAELVIGYVEHFVFQAIISYPCHYWHWQVSSWFCPSVSLYVCLLNDLSALTLKDLGHWLKFYGILHNTTKHIAILDSHAQSVFDSSLELAIISWDRSVGQC